MFLLYLLLDKLLGMIRTDNPRQLDIAFFPHIFDLIFDFADVEALAQLRLTCRSLRDRVDAEWSHLQWNVAPQAPSVVHNRRGAIVPTNSPCLRLTKALDLTVDQCEAGRSHAEFPDDLKLEVLRVIDYVFDPDNMALGFPTASTVITFDPRTLGEVLYAVSHPSCEVLNVVLKFDNDSVLDLDIELVAHSMARLTVGATGGCLPVNVYVVLSGCNPDSMSLGWLLLCIMEYLRDRQLCGSRLIEYRVLELGDPLTFYLVEPSSWFSDPETGESPVHGPQDDRTWPTSGELIGMMMDAANRWDLRLNPHEERDDWWPTPERLECLNNIRRISKEEMRQRVGDRAYELTFASPDPSSFTSAGNKLP